MCIESCEDCEKTKDVIVPYSCSCNYSRFSQGGGTRKVDMHFAAIVSVSKYSTKYIISIAKMNVTWDARGFIRSIQ